MTTDPPPHRGASDGIVPLEGRGPSEGSESSDRGATGFFMHEAAPLHDTGWGHPEHQGRLRSLASAVGKDLPDLLGRVQLFEPSLAPVEALARVHPLAWLEALEAKVTEARETGEVLSVEADTRVSGATWDAVCGSAGAGIEAGERVARGELRNAFVAARPPGHHATATEAMGFCLVNNVAVVARHLQAIGAASRIAIVDWDVHHGNGTQAIFEDDPSVYFISLHQSPAYPGTGGAGERGTGAGHGFTLNVPLPAGTSGAVFHEALDAALATVEAAFDPDFILVSAGYDALAGDPLGGMALEPEDYHGLMCRVMAWADRAAQGRVVVLLEGGYDPRRTGEAVVQTLRALSGLPVRSHSPR
jgi:acetoin utilization deacetylase AcuC-like enzyme